MIGGGGAIMSVPENIAMQGTCHKAMIMLQSFVFKLVREIIIWCSRHLPQFVDISEQIRYISGGFDKGVSDHTIAS